MPVILMQRKSPALLATGAFLMFVSGACRTQQDPLAHTDFYPNPSNNNGALGIDLQGTFQYSANLCFLADNGGNGITLKFVEPNVACANPSIPIRQGKKFDENHFLQKSELA